MTDLILQRLNNPQFLREATDDVYSHMSGGIRVEERDRNGIQWREVENGLSILFRELQCHHEWGNTGGWEICKKCKKSKRKT